MNPLTTTAPIRVASLPKPYLRLAARSYTCAATTAGLRHAPTLSRQKRCISSTPHKKTEEFFPPPKTPHISKVESWSHPMYVFPDLAVANEENEVDSPSYTYEQMQKVTIAHRDAKDWADWVALGTVRLLRWGMDFVTRYRHPTPGRENDPKFKMTEKKWLTRFVFLESVAGVPGMVGGMLRHLRSLRRMKRDNGWIETLLEEAQNERMHLLTFLKLAEPGLFMRLMVLGAQGVFFNGFFLSYLVSPRICHRFVAYLEEEAVITYSRAVHDIESGALPRWTLMEAPEIAISYWKMPEGHHTMKDLLLYVRADEAKHREVNHTLGNLNQGSDPNPYSSKYKDSSKAHPSKGIDKLKPTGWEREEVI